MILRTNAASVPIVRIFLSLLAAVLLAAFAGTEASRAQVPEASLSVLEKGLRPTVLRAGQPLPGWSLQERMAHHRVPGVAIALVRDGQIVQAAGFGVLRAGTDRAVDADTLFSVGSISKMITAATALRLVADGQLGLDRDINHYLRSWQIPPAPELPGAMVTARMLLSHTAGLNVHGFRDYQPGEPLPSLVQILNGAAPAKNDPVHLLFAPGSRMKYSGGGTMVVQQVIEDITGGPLESAARNAVFQPAGMRRSTFANPLPASLGNIAMAHDRTGSPAALPRGWESFPESAASGLWTSANDLGAFLAALLRSYRGEGRWLPQAIAAQMLTEVGPSWHGLGPRLDGAGATRIFHHGGSNDSYRAWIEGYPESGDGFVILTNGHGGGALLIEIRNALSDALGHGVDRPIRAGTLPAGASPADYAGRYRIDPASPPFGHRSLAQYFESEFLDVTVRDGALSVRDGDAEDADVLELLPLAPARFTAVGDFMPPQFEFHRSADGAVGGLSIGRGSSRMYLRRQPAGTSSMSGRP
jgi:CubicO group peptidase (beta-lactamase class C family)